MKSKQVILLLNKILFYSFLVFGIIALIFNLRSMGFRVLIFASFLASWALSFVLKSKGIPIKYEFLINLALWLNLAGELTFYYNGAFFTYYDKILHLIIGFFITVIIYKYYSLKLGIKKDMILFTVIGLFAIWEFYEYAGTLIFDYPFVGVYHDGIMIMSSYDDTMWDMIFGTLGSLLYLIFKKEYHKKRKK